MGEGLNLKILSKWVHSRLDKETIKILQERVYRMEGTGFSLPSSRELVGMVGWKWEISKGRRRSVVMIRGNI